MLMGWVNIFRSYVLSKISLRIKTNKRAAKIGSVGNDKPILEPNSVILTEIGVAKAIKI